MNHRISLGLAALALTASSAAFADAHINVDINPFGSWGAPPPVVYASPRYYAPPAVYVGRGRYGERHDDRDRGRHDDRGHDDRHR
jgi:hypothetical protein